MFFRVSLPKTLPDLKDWKNQDRTCANFLSDDIAWDEIPDADVKKIIKAAFRRVTKKLKSEGFGYGGTTVSISLQIPGQKGTRIFFANAGDSCSMLLHKSKDNLVDIRFRTTDHSASSLEEQKRIKAQGGAVGYNYREGVMRIMNDGIPSLSPSRGLGDHIYEPHVSHTPIVTKYYVPAWDRANVRVAHFSDGIYKAIPEGWVEPSSKNAFTLDNDLTRHFTEMGNPSWREAQYMLPDTNAYDAAYIGGASWTDLVTKPNTWLHQFLEFSQQLAHDDAFGVGIDDSDDTTGEIVTVATPKTGAILSGVFDGHGMHGDKYAAFASENLGAEIEAFIRAHRPQYCIKALLGKITYQVEEYSLLRFVIKCLCTQLEKVASPAVSNARFFANCRSESGVDVSVERVFLGWGIV